MSEISPQEVASATTREQVDSLIARGADIFDLMRTTPYYLAMIQEYRDLVAQAAPLYKELHSSVPYYANRPLDDPFWSDYIYSRMVEARMLVERHRNSTAPSTAASN